MNVAMLAFCILLIYAVLKIGLWVVLACILCWAIHKLIKVTAV